MTNEKDRIYDAALKILSCSDSQVYILKDLEDMEEFANKHGGEYRGLANIVRKMTEETEAQTWKIINTMGM